jgi:hypothetical protein
MQFWTSLTGRPFENAYGTTELGGVAIRVISKIKVCADSKHLAAQETQDVCEGLDWDPLPRRQGETVRR